VVVPRGLARRRGARVNFSGILREGDRDHVLSLTLREGELRGTHDGHDLHPMRAERRDGGILLGRAREFARAVVARDGARILVHLHGRVHEFEVVDATRRSRDGGGRRHHPGDEPRAASPMTGIVAAVPVKAGDAVAAGGTLAVVEAMKMQFVVRAPRAVVVKAVRAAAGDPVDIGAVLVEFAE
jgi:biotin carboxyl carrier protein